MHNETLELKCISCVPQKLTEAEYKDMCIGLIHILGISPKSMSVLTQLQHAHNRKLRYFKPSELDMESISSFSCISFCEKHNLEYVCKCCKHSGFHNNIDETVEHMILTFCLQSRDADYVINKMKNKGVASNELFSSVFIADSSRTDAYIPLNRCIMDTITEMAPDMKKMANDELTDCIMKNVSDEFHLPEKIINRIKKHILSFFDETYTNIDIDNAFNSIFADTKISESETVKNIPDKSVPDKTDSTSDIDSNLEISENIDMLQELPGHETEEVFCENNSMENDEIENISVPDLKLNTSCDISDDFSSSENIDTGVNGDSIYMEETASFSPENAPHVPDIDRDCLDEFGFLKNNITENSENIIPMQNFDEIRYDFLQATALAAEYAVLNGQSGILFYLPACKKYYFFSFHGSTKDVSELASAILADKNYHLKIVMFDIPFLFYLNKNGFSVENYVSLMELYLSAYRDSKCTPDELVARLVGEKADIPFPFIVSAMRYYYGLYKKYHSFITQKRPESINFFRLKHHMNSCLSHSFFISDILPYKKCYIKRNAYNEISFDYQSVKDIIPEKYTIFSLSYKNPVKTERIYIALKSVCSKISSTSLQKTCSVTILDLNRENLITSVPNKHARTYLSALNHIAIKQGQRYVCSVPQINIISSKNF